MRQDIHSQSHILVVTGFWPTDTNSISGIFVVQQMAAFLRSGFKVTVLIPKTFGRNSGKLIAPATFGLDASKIEIHSVSTLRIPDRLSQFFSILKLNIYLNGKALARFLACNLSDYKFDACIVHGERDSGLSLPLWRNLLQGRIAVVIHGVDPFWNINDNKISGRGMLQLMSSEIDAVVLVGRPLFSYVEGLGITSDKVIIIANGTDIPTDNFVPKTGVIGAPRRILSVSNLILLKGIDDNLRALHRLLLNRPELSWEYHIVGDGSDRARLELMVLEMGLSSRVKFLGRLSYEDTMLEIVNSDIFSLPSWNEAFGIVYLEAMARGKPVIGCYENGAAEIVNDGNDGFLIPPKSVSDLSIALERLIDDPALCERIGKMALITSKNYSWDINVTRMIDVLGLYN